MDLSAYYPRSNPSNWIRLVDVPAQTTQLYVAEAGVVSGAQSNLIATHTAQIATQEAFRLDSRVNYSTNSGNAATVGGLTSTQILATASNSFVGVTDARYLAALTNAPALSSVLNAGYVAINDGSVSIPAGQYSTAYLSMIFPYPVAYHDYKSWGIGFVNNQGKTNMLCGGIGGGISIPDGLWRQEFWVGGSVYKIWDAGNFRAGSEYVAPDGDGSTLTGITAAQVGAVATNDTRYLAALTNGQQTVDLGLTLTQAATTTPTDCGPGRRSSGSVSPLPVRALAVICDSRLTARAAPVGRWRSRSPSSPSCTGSLSPTTSTR
jgi:hypothetical protein